MSVKKSHKTVSKCMRWHEETTLHMESRETEREKENERKHAHEFETERIVVAVLCIFSCSFSSETMKCENPGKCTQKHD